MLNHSPEDNTMRRLAIFVALVTSSVALAADDEAAKAALKGLEGSYLVTGFATVSESTPEADLAALEAKLRTLVIRGDRVTFPEYFGVVGKDGTLRVDPSKKPAWVEVDMKVVEGKTITVKGIYKRDGDVLTVCLGGAKPDELPTEFKATKGTLLLTFKKQPAKK